MSSNQQSIQGRPATDHQQKERDRQAGASSWMRTLIEARENCRDALNRCTMDPAVVRDQVVNAPENQRALHGWILDYHRHMEIYRDHPTIRRIWEAERDDVEPVKVTVPDPEGSDNVIRVNHYHEARDEVGTIPSGDGDEEEVTLAKLPKWRNREINWTERVIARREGGRGARTFEFTEPIYLPVNVAEKLYEHLNDAINELGFAAQIAEIETYESESDMMETKPPQQ